MITHDSTVCNDETFVCVQNDCSSPTQSIDTSIDVKMSVVCVCVCFHDEITQCHDEPETKAEIGFEPRKRIF